MARQNTTYNQPSYTDFYLASDMEFGDVPLRAAWLPGSVKALQNAVEDLVESGEIAGPVASQLTAAAQQARRPWRTGDAAKAAQAIQRFVKFLAQQKNPDKVSDTRQGGAEPQRRQRPPRIREIGLRRMKPITERTADC